MYKMYTIRDEISTTGRNIFLAKNDNEAMREMAGWLIRSKKENKYFRWEDYTLVCLGIYDEDKQEVKIPEKFPYNLQKINNFFNPEIFDSPDFNNIDTKDEKEKAKIIKDF